MLYESSFIDFIKKFKIPGCGVDQRFTRTKYNDKTTDYCHSLKDIYKLSCKFSGILWDGFRVKCTEDIKYYCTVSVFLFTAGNLAQTLNGVPRVFQNHSVTVSFTWHKASMQADNFSINIVFSATERMGQGNLFSKSCPNLNTLCVNDYWRHQYP